MVGRREVVLLVVAIAIGVAPLPLLGGRWSRVAHIALRGTGWLWAAVAAQVVAYGFDAVGPRAAPVVHVGSYALLVPFLATNRALRGMRWVLAGALLNLAAIAANGGVMPASPAAVRSAGLELGETENSRPVDRPRLAELGDVWAVPAGLPFANVFSPGDVLLVLGGIRVIHTAAGSRLRRARRRGGNPPDLGPDTVSDEVAVP